MKRAIALVLAACAGVAGFTATPAAAASSQHIAGVGHFTLDDVNVVGHRIRFAIQARTAPDGTTRGSFRFRHLLPDGSLLARGRADVTCLEVSGDTALVTAQVTREHIPPTPPGLPLGPHAFYVKIIDGGDGDRIVFTQAIGQPGPRECIDVEEMFPGQLKRYPIEPGGFLIHGPRAVAA